MGEHDLLNGSFFLTVDGKEVPFEGFKEIKILDGNELDIKTVMDAGTMTVDVKLPRDFEKRVKTAINRINRYFRREKRQKEKQRRRMLKMEDAACD